MTEALDLHKTDLEGFLLQDLESPVVPHSAHSHRLTYHISPVSIIHLFNRLNRGIPSLTEGCWKDTQFTSYYLPAGESTHKNTKNKTWQAISTYKNNWKECFLIKGRLSARRAFSYKTTLAGESTNELFPPPFTLPTGLPPEHTGNHSASCLTIPVVLKNKQCASEDNVHSQMGYLSPGKLWVLWDVLFRIKKSLFSHHWSYARDPLILVKIPMLQFQTAQMNKWSMKVNEE